MLRWSKILPRLVLLAVLVGTVFAGVESAVKWRLVESFDASGRLKLEPARITTNLSAASAHHGARCGRRPSMPR